MINDVITSHRLFLCMLHLYSTGRVGFFDNTLLFVCVCVCRGVVRVDVNLQDVDIDQCSSTGWFAGTHRCNLTTMEVSRPPNAFLKFITRYNLDSMRPATNA